MADQYTEVTHSGYFKNVFNSFIGALLGVLLFLGSFVVLWINEGTVNLATIAQKSTPALAATVDPALDGKLLAATGKLSSSETLGDESFLRPGNYLALNRTVEMYAWVEHTSSETKKNVGGSSTTETTYTYKKEWTSNPESTSSFRHAAGHENPSMPFENASWKVSSATLGAYTVDPQTLELPGGSELSLDDAATELDDGWLIKSGYIVNAANALTSPKVGDMRVSYSAVPNNVDVTLFGKASAGQLVPFEAKGTSLYRAFTENREAAIQTLDTEYRLWIWIMRLIGFFMMWFGLIFCFGPINTMLDVLPFLGGAGRLVTSAVMFGISLLLSILTIVISIIAHNIFLLIGVFLLVVGGIYLWGRMRKPKVVAQPA